MRTQILKTLLVAILMAPFCASAEVEVFDEAWCQFVIRGEISARDAEAVVELSDCRNPVVFLHDSPGGDVQAGMKIGRWIRENQAPTTVAQNQRCYSTCALVFIAGVERRNLGVIGLHRPYLAGAPQPRELIPELVTEMMDEVRTYILEMGARPEFASVMLETLPEQVREYDGSEIYELVAERTAVYDEIEAARNARIYGVSTGEYRLRQQETGRECRINEFSDSSSEPTTEEILGWLYCQEAVLWGLSEPLYLRRIEAVRARCVLSRGADDSDEYIECQRSVMRGE